jgi:hypothetical protein
VVYHQHGRDGDRVLDPGQRPAAPCPRCGRAARVTEMLIVYDRDFYGNAERLAGLMT